MDDVIVRYSKKNMGNYIDDYYVEEIIFCDIIPAIIVEKLNDAKLKEYIIYIKRYLGINPNNREPEIISDIFKGYEDLQIFRENITLWDSAISFIEYLPSVFKNFCSKKNLYSYLVAAIIIVHKYHIDDSYENNVVADYFSIDLKLLNKCEMKILLKFNHHLPFIEKDLVIFPERYNKLNSNLNLNLKYNQQKIKGFYKESAKKKMQNSNLNLQKQLEKTNQLKPARKHKIIKIKK